MAETLEQLSKLIADQLRQQLPQQQPAPQALQPNTGWPSIGPPPGQFQFGQPTGPATVFGGPIPQPTGVSIPLVVPLFDGRQVHVRLHFPAEAAANLQQLLNYCAQVYGQHLVARAPYRNYGGFNNNYYYGRGRGR